jgi:hypothetical protein
MRSPLKYILTFPVKCFGQAASLHKGRVILTNHARELEFQWESDDDVRDTPPDKQQLLLPNRWLKCQEAAILILKKKGRKFRFKKKKTRLVSGHTTLTKITRGQILINAGEIFVQFYKFLNFAY